MDTKYAFAIVAVIIIALGAYAFLGKEPASTKTSDVTVAAGDVNGDGAAESAAVDADGSPTITLTDDGFTPASVTIKEGQSVTFVNKSSKGMWIGSDVHPSHTEYSGTARQDHCPDTTGTAFDQCGVGDTFTFKFTKVGTWGFHNHVGATSTGTVTVTE